MKQLFRYLGALLLCLSAQAAPTALSLPAQSATVPINRIVAVVNNDIITANDLNLAVQAAIRQYHQHNMVAPSKKALREQVLQGLIYQKLQLQLAKQNNITIEDKQLDEAIANVAKQNNLTVAELHEKLRQQGISFEQFKQQIRDQMVITNLQQQALSNKIHLTSEDFIKFKQQLAERTTTTQYHVMDYLIALPENPTAAQKNEALEMSNTLKNALQNNQPLPPSVASNDLGWRTIENLPDLFAVHVVKMSDGHVTKPLLAGNGYHVLKLLETKQQTQNVADEQARQLLYQEKFQRALKKWLEHLSSTAYIKIYSNS